MAKKPVSKNKTSRSSATKKKKVAARVKTRPLAPILDAAFASAAGTKIPAIRTVMLPRDTNHLGSIFGGVILSLIDLAAGQHARGIAPKKYVTKVMREVNFIAPVHVGDVVSFYTSTSAIGRTSVTVRVDVQATRGIDLLEEISVTSAEVVMVAVNDAMKPIPITPG